MTQIASKVCAWVTSTQWTINPSTLSNENRLGFVSNNKKIFDLNFYLLYILSKLLQVKINTFKKSLFIKQENTNRVLEQLNLIDSVFLNHTVQCTMFVTWNNIQLQKQLLISYGVVPSKPSSRRTVLLMWKLLSFPFFGIVFLLCGTYPMFFKEALQKI